VLSPRGGDSGSILSASKVSSIFRPLERSHSGETPDELAGLAGFVMGGSDSDGGSSDGGGPRNAVSAAFLEQSGDGDPDESETPEPQASAPKSSRPRQAALAVTSPEIDYSKQHFMHGGASSPDRAVAVKPSSSSSPAPAAAVAPSVSASLLESILEEDAPESLAGSSVGDGSWDGADDGGEDATITVESFAQSSFASSDSLLSLLSAGSDVSEESGGSVRSSLVSSTSASSPRRSTPAATFGRSQSIPVSAYREMSASQAAPEPRRPGAPVVSAMRRSGSFTQRRS